MFTRSFDGATANRSAHIACAAIGAALLWLATGGVARAASTEWALATGYPESSFHVVNLHRFASAVEKTTQGKLRIRVYSGGVKVRAAEIRQAILDGTIDAGEMFGPSLGGLHAAFAVDALPFLATSYVAAQRLAEAARPTVRDQLARQGYVLLYSVSWPPQGLFSNRPIKTPSDLQGLRIRENSPPVKRVAELLGGNPVRVETPALEAAVADKQVDAVFTSAAQGMDTMMWRHMPYFYTANAWLPRNLVVVNQKAFNALEPAVRNTVMKLAAEAEANGQDLSEQDARSSVEMLRLAGAKIGVLPPPVRSQLDRAGETVAREIVAAQKNTELLSILGAYFTAK